MILLQILTGRRASEIRTCVFDCLSPVPGRAAEAAEASRSPGSSYAQSKIDIAPGHHPGRLRGRRGHRGTAAVGPRPVPRHPRRSHLFLQRTGNRPWRQALPVGHLQLVPAARVQRHRSDHRQQGPARPAQPHPPFRHTKLTRLAELGLPVHVLQRYAGHATPTMSMHYIAQREEHAEQAFLATVKLKADGTRVAFSREDHDILHLFDRADRFLPNGWCLLPPLQSCGKGNACLTCSVFVTDADPSAMPWNASWPTPPPHRPRHHRFQQRHGRPMPEDNVWLAQRRAEHARARPACWPRCKPRPAAPCKAPDAAPRPPGPVPLTLDLASHRKDHAMTTSAPAAPRSWPPPPKPNPRRKPTPPTRPSAGWSNAASPSPSRPSSAKPASPTPSSTAIPTCAAGSSTCAPRPARSRSRPATPTRDNTLILALTSQITHLKKQHRPDQALRAALEQAHGENLQLRRELTRLGWTGEPATT